MMRKLFVLAMVAGLVGMGGFVREARAGATVDLLFVGLNGGAIGPTNTVLVNPSDTLTMAVLITNDEPMIASFFSLNYDLDLDNELDPTAVFLWAGLPINAKGTDFYSASIALAPTTPTFIGSFQGITSNLALPRTIPAAGGAFAGGYQLGTVVWHANGGDAGDGADIISGILNFGVDGILDQFFNDMAPDTVFRSATVNFIPEPGTASLLGLGLVGLVLMGRRSRS